MNYRNLGLIERVSEIGFGGWQIGGELSISGNPLSYGKVDESESKEAIRTALDIGVNFFDSADIYGLGRSESIIGDELSSQRKSVLLCSKAGYVPDGNKGTITDCSREHIIASCNRSLKRMKTDYLDVFLVHFVPSENQIDETVVAMRMLKNSGKIREFGISVANNLGKIKTLAGVFPIIEGYYNLLLRDVEEFFPLMKERGTGFIAASPLSRGLLGGSARERYEESDVRKKWEKGNSQHDWYKQQQEKVGLLRKVAEEMGMELKNLSLAYLLSSPISTIIPGIRNGEQIRDLANSLRFVPMSTEKIEKIRGLKYGLLLA